MHAVKLSPSPCTCAFPRRLSRPPLLAADALVDSKLEEFCHNLRGALQSDHIPLQLRLRLHGCFGALQGW